MLKFMLLLLLGLVVLSHVNSQPTLTFRSILGDPGMKWKNINNKRPSSQVASSSSLSSTTFSSGPRMQLFFYNLCSKAGYQNMSVIPSQDDTCSKPVPDTIIGFGSVEQLTVKENNSDVCCNECLKRPYCLSWTLWSNRTKKINGTSSLSWYCDFKDNTVKVKEPSPAPRSGLPLYSGIRLYHPSQELPSPRYANCIVDGKQTINMKDNAARNQIETVLDDEWYAVEKEHRLADKCRTFNDDAAPSFFWTVMSQNGNAQSYLGSSSFECLPYCYSHKLGYPPAVNASMSTRCKESTKNSPPLTFNNQPMNQPKTMTHFTDPSSEDMHGSFNWTFELESDLTLSEKDFSKNYSLGIWSWKYDHRLQKAIVRIYQRVSKMYPWICTYFGVDVVKGVKANQAYDGRGMMLERPIVGTDFIVEFFLNITRDQTGGGGGVGSWYLLNMEACWNQVTGKMCTPYENTNEIAHQQVLLDYGGTSSGCSNTSIGGCPKYHINKFFEKIHRNNTAEFPYDAYKQYCCPCTTCSECQSDPNDLMVCCDPMSNPDGQSIYKLAPHPIWNEYGFPINSTDGFVNHPKMHRLHVGKLWERIWFPCMATEPIELITFNIGPETGYGVANGTHDTEFFISDFDVLVPSETEK
jgi:hypothetical protein